MDRIGRYKIVGELGRGAMGVVYHAIDPNIGRPVAIKTIHFGGGRNAEEQNRLRERLFREARSAGILSHPGIVTVYDVEQQGELAYIAMEFVDGPTLDQVLSEAYPISPERMFSILGQTAVALDYAHQKGIVHRDIKPANIMIARDGTAKITDFGIAKITASDQLTMTGNIVGTPHYMSPEQVQGQPVDGRSDQFSLAVIAFEMLTGEKPYSGEHLTTVVYKIVAEEPAAPHRLNPTLGGAIESVLRRSLSKKPEARYPTCQEFAGALEKACAASKGWKTMPRGGSLNEPTMVDSAKPVVTLPPARRAHRAEATTTAERGERRSARFLPFLLAILVAAGLLALIGWQAAPWLSNQVQATKAPVPPPVRPRRRPALRLRFGRTEAQPHAARRYPGGERRRRERARGKTPRQARACHRRHPAGVHHQQPRRGHRDFGRRSAEGLQGALLVGRRARPPHHLHHHARVSNRAPRSGRGIEPGGNAPGNLAAAGRNPAAGQRAGGRGDFSERAPHPAGHSGADPALAGNLHHRHREGWQAGERHGGDPQRRHQPPEDCS